MVDGLCLSAAVVGIAGFMLFFYSIKIVRPTERGVIESLGKYGRFAGPGMHVLFPFIEKMYMVQVTEQVVDATRQEIITNDNLNAQVDAQIYYKIKNDEESVKRAFYNVADVNYQIVQLARTTLRNIIGTMTLKDVNSERNSINVKLAETLSEQTVSWGVQVVRAELKEIQPPQEVQNVMNEVVIAANKKVAAVDLATAAETQADGMKRAAIKEAEGEGEARIIRANAEANAIKAVNVAANTYFVGNAQTLRALEAAERALKDNSKIIVSEGTSIVAVLQDAAGIGNIIPIKQPKK